MVVSGGFRGFQACFKTGDIICPRTFKTRLPNEPKWVKFICCCCWGMIERIYCIEPSCFNNVDGCY